MEKGELVLNRLINELPKDLTDNFQIFRNDSGEFEKKKIRVLVLDKLPTDEQVEYLKDGGWKKYNLLVFPSYWLQSMYKSYLGIPFSAGTVIKSGVTPVEPHVKTNEKIRIVYHAKPYFGLELLYIAFRLLSANFEELHLDVYSSFSDYRWEEEDKGGRELFRLVREHPKITYYQSASNKEVVDGLKRANIFVMPATSPQIVETNLIEAMSSGLVCVHSTNGPLPEIAMNLTYMYEYSEDAQEHLNRLYTHLLNAIRTVKEPTKELQTNLELQKQIVDTIYNWDRTVKDWEKMLKGLLTK